MLVDNALEQVELAKIRAFAYLLLSSAVSPNAKRLTTIANLFKNALTAGRACLRANMLDLADKITQNEAIIETLISKRREMDGEPDAALSCVIEYYCLRILLEWKRKRSDLTDYYYKRMSELGFVLQETEIEKTIDLFYEIGRESLSRNDSVDIDNAVKWLDRAQRMLDTKDYFQVFAGSELRLNVMHSLGEYIDNTNRVRLLTIEVQALIRLPEKLHAEKIQSLLRELKSEYGPKLPILLLSLEVICAQPDHYESDSFGLQLQEIIRSVHLIDTNHRLVMHYIHKLNSQSHSHALTCIKAYILQRLNPEDMSEWKDQTILSYITIISENQTICSTAELQNLEQDLTQFAETSKSELHPSAAQAAHVLIWKMIRENDTDDTRSSAMIWCQIGLHHIFASAGEAANGKLERQLISYHLLVSNNGLAHQMLEQMSFIQKNNRSSRYLAYCVALRSGNDADAQSCLNTITNGQGENDQLLFACVGESVKYGKPLNTAHLLQRIFDKQLQASTTGSDLDLGALLQYTTSMLLQAISDCPSDRCPDQEVLARICYTFKHATRLAEKQDANSKARSRSRINVGWFEKYGFQLAKAHMNIWPRRFLIDLLYHCEHLSNLQKITPMETLLKEDNKKHLCESMFIHGVLYASEARNVSASYSVEDLPESSYDSKSKPKTSECQSVLYRNVFTMFTNLQRQFASGKAVDDDRSESIKSQLHVLIPLAFEALLFLNVNAYVSNETAFDEVSVSQFLNTANELELPVASYALLADTLLAFACDDSKAGGLRVPSITAARLLGKIIQAIRESHVYNIEQAARWIRCVAQLIFEDIDATLAGSCTETPPKTGQSLNMLDSIVQQATSLANTTPNHPTYEANSAASRVPGMSNNNSQQYPVEELHWLATRMWNMAIDFHGIRQNDAAQKWAGKAVQAAEVMMNKDGNMTRFVGQLKDNIKNLGWII